LATGAQIANLSYKADYVCGIDGAFLFAVIQRQNAG
jgi:hypothetical protein